MPFTISHCTEADIPRFFEIVSLAFSHDHEYIDSVFPDHYTPEGRAAGAERMLTSMRTDPNTTFLKVVNDEAQMIAAAKWNIYNGVIPSKPTLSGDHWKNEEEQEFAQYMFDGYLIPRLKEIRDSGGNLVVLDMLVVDPLHQRQGAGRMLVKWGTSVADKMRANESELASVSRPRRLSNEVGVEAGDYSRGLYAQEGFKVLEHYEVPIPSKFTERRKQSFW